MHDLGLEFDQTSSHISKRRFSSYRLPGQAPKFWLGELSELLSFAYCVIRRGATVLFDISRRNSAVSIMMAPYLNLFSLITVVSIHDFSLASVPSFCSVNLQNSYFLRASLPPMLAEVLPTPGHCSLEALNSHLHNLTARTGLFGSQLHLASTV